MYNYISKLENTLTLLDTKSRIYSIDILRGIIMILMALDHVRDFFTNIPFDPLDLSKTTTPLFLTRWITHFCAPTFVFLSGTSVYLTLLNGKSKKQASLLLLTRGLWLIFLECTVISFGWVTTDPTITLQVIWAIGWSMIFLSALIYLKPIYVLLIAILLIAGHNFFDRMQAISLGEGELIWMIFHQQGFYPLSNSGGIFIMYPLIPWVGVMAAGYAFGSLFNYAPSIRQNIFIKIGVSFIILFLILRIFNLYGDPFPWQETNLWWKNILAVIKVHKYPPSLLYVLMTLGISISALGLLESVNNRFSQVLSVFGKVPMFYYVLHLYLIHGVQILVGVLSGYPLENFMGNFFNKIPKDWGYNLLTVYLIWLGIVTVLYFPCRWYVRLKQRRKDWWLSYI